MGTGAVQDGLSDILQFAELLALNQPEQAALDRYAPALLEHVGEFTDHFYTSLETVGLEDMEQWTQGLKDLVGAIDRELLKNSGPRNGIP